MNSSRRPTAHPAPPRRLTTFGNDGKWMDPSPSSLKTKAGSVKVQLQRKRVFLGSLIDEYTFVVSFHSEIKCNFFFFTERFFPNPVSIAQGYRS